MLHTEKNGPRENIQSMDRATPKEILVKDNGKEVDTLETIAVRCGNNRLVHRVLTRFDFKDEREGSKRV